MMLVDDVLLSADHILERISPHLAPESLTLTTGLDHYLRSLEKSKSLIERTKLVLGGHERPFQNLFERIDETRTLYENRLAQVLDLARTPKTIAEFAQELFGDTVGYHRLLAVEEAGAYVEYLSLRGTLRVDDLEKLERGELFAIRYQSEDGWSSEIPCAEPTAEGEKKVGELDVRI